MTKFTVIYREAGESSPKRVVMKGADESSLRRECEAKGWQVLLVRHAKWMGYGRRFKWVSLRGYEIQLPFPLGVWTAELVAFCEVLCTLSKTGVPLLQIIDICIQDANNAWFRKRLQIVRERLQSGDSLSTAVEDPRCVKAFPPVLRKRIRIEESNGRLGDALARFNATLRFEKARREVIGLCGLFPALLVGVVPVGWVVEGLVLKGPLLLPLGYWLVSIAICAIMWVVLKYFTTRIALKTIRGAWWEELWNKSHRRNEPLVCRTCGKKIDLKELRRAKGRCPNCDAEIPVSDYCVCRPETRWWHLYSVAPTLVRKPLGCPLGVMVVALPCIGSYMFIDAIGVWDGFALLAGVGALAFLVVRQSFLGGRLYWASFLAMAITLGCMVFIPGVDLHVSTLFIALDVTYMLALLPLWMEPSSRRWIRSYRDERLAYAIACDCGFGATVRSGMELPLRVDVIVRFAICVAVVGLLGVGLAILLVLESSTYRFGVNQSQLVQLDKELHDCGISDFLDGATNRLVATNRVDETKQVLDRGIALVGRIANLIGSMENHPPARKEQKGMWEFGRLHGRPFWMALGVQLRRARKTLDHLALWNDVRCRWELHSMLGVDSNEEAYRKIRTELAALDEPLRQARKIVGHFALWNDDERRGELRAVFGVDTDEALAAKFAEELADFDKLSRRAKEADAR